MPRQHFRALWPRGRPEGIFEQTVGPEACPSSTSERPVGPEAGLCSIYERAVGAERGLSGTFERSVASVCKKQGIKYIFSIGRTKQLINTHKKLGYHIDDKPSHEIVKTI